MIRAKGWSNKGKTVVISYRAIIFEDGSTIFTSPPIVRDWHDDYFTDEEWENAKNNFSEETEERSISLWKKMISILKSGKVRAKRARA